MRKLIGAAAVCAVAVGLVAAPGALGVKSTKRVGGFVTANVTPNPVVINAPVTASGNLASNSNCRKFRDVTVQWFSGTTPVVDPAPVTVETRSNGNWTATIAAPSMTGSYTLNVTVAQTTRKVGGKHKKTKKAKSRQFLCLALPTAGSPPISVPVTVNPA